MKQNAQSGAAGSSTFSGSDSRRYNYFEPSGRRATVYEDVTVDVQPDPSRHLLQGWIMSFANGDPTHGEHTTVIKCSDWHVFRAPDQEWSRTHYQRQSHIENTIKMVVDNARSDGAPGRFDEAWVTVLQDQLGALKHAEFGIGVALMTAQRDGVTQMVNNTMLTNASYKLRLSQDITLYLGDIGLDIEIDPSAGKKVWMEDESWQATRKVVECILAARDHMEVYFAINVIFEPLFGDMLRGGFFMRASPAHNDFVTPAVVSSAGEDCRRNLANTLTLLKMVNDDAEHGAANKTIQSGWLEKYVPLCLDATNQLKPLWDQQNNADVDFTGAVAQAQQKFDEILTEIEVSLPEGIGL